MSSNGYLKHQHQIPFWQIAIMGLLLTALVWSFVLLAANAWGIECLATPQSLIYNLPISFLFATLAVELFLSTMPFGWDTFKPQIPFVVIWAVGLIQLYLRLVEHSIPASGHMTWIPLLLTQIRLRRLPVWFMGIAAAVLVQVAWFNFYELPTVFAGRNGLLLGAALSLALWIWLRTEKLDKA